MWPYAHPFRFFRSGAFFMVFGNSTSKPMVGFEPTAYSLRKSCSTTELHRRASYSIIHTHSLLFIFPSEAAGESLLSSGVSDGNSSDSRSVTSLIFSSAPSVYTLDAFHKSQP